MEASFELVSPPTRMQLPAFRFAHHKVRGPYVPWSRVHALDVVAETLERLGIERVGPAFGIYHDLPASTRDSTDWTARLGYPVAEAATVPPSPALRVVDVPATDVVGLRYRGDLTSFPGALQFLMEWALRQDVVLEGCLLERFYVSNAMTGEEDRDVYVAVRPFVLP